MLNVIETKNVNNYSLIVKGVFGRNRTTKLDVITLAETEDKLSMEEIRRLANNKIMEIKLKPAAFVKVTEKPMKLEKYSDGAVIRSYMIFNDATLLQATYSGANV